MHIRPMQAADLEQCEVLEHTYTTQRVWQVVVERRAQTAVEEAEIVIRVRATRLPRPLVVTLPSLETPLWAAVDRYDGFWVLIDHEGTIHGYAALHAHPGQPMAELSLINVAPASRRQGGGSLLLQQALSWARSCGLDGLIVHAPSRADPAICFYRHHGFHFSGYSENFYANQDIALFFAREL